MNQISVFLENRSGQLAHVCKTLASSQISLMALSLSESQEFGIARLIVDDSARAESVLRNEHFLVKTTSVVAVAVPDRPGGMSEVATRLSERGCDIAYSYAFSFCESKRAVLVFRFKDESTATTVLAEAGFKMLSETDLKSEADVVDPS